MITYKLTCNHRGSFATCRWLVFLDKKKVGDIRRHKDGYVYHPGGKNSDRGESFDTLIRCKKSLEG